MADIKFDELGKKERILLLRAYDYDVDDDGFILNTAGDRMRSKEVPKQFLSIDNVALVSGSLDILDGTPSSISKFIRETEEKKRGSSRD